jgi:uncharacterized repeat protein (TIGR03803 family)
MTKPAQHLNRISGTRHRAASAALALVVVLGLAVVAAQSARAQTYKESFLYSFTGTGGDGEYPSAGVIRDAAGNLYGTTQYGGNLSCGGGSGCGVVFKVDSNGKESVLYSFCPSYPCPDGAQPKAGLVQDVAGNLYGTAGIVFRVDANGKETVLYKFRGGRDGNGPFAGLIRDAAGNLYGTTLYGGTSGCGGVGCGTVFKVDKNNKETVLYRFIGGTTDGALTYSGLVHDSTGNLYGTTEVGGGTGCHKQYPGCGVVFKVDKTGKESVLYSFTGKKDGALPYAGFLVRDANGNLYGTTTFGGLLSCGQGSGCGVVFKVDKTGKESVLYSFTGKKDGANPLTGVIIDGKDNLYGTASAYNSTFGTVFKVSNTGKFSVLYSFRGGTDGRDPVGPLILDQAGNLYGTTSRGGNSDYGTVFKLTP